MTNLEKAIEIEKTNFPNEIDYDKLAELIKPIGFDKLSTYFNTKREYLFSRWIPEVYRIPIEKFANVVESAVVNGNYGIYIPVSDGIHAYHGTDDIDYDLCKDLDVKVVELNYAGGTIIGSADDISIEVVFPKIMSMCHPVMIDKFCEIIGKYVPNTTRVGNDILVDGKKVSGSMTREVGDSFVWAAQITFGDYSEYIEKICQKPAIKKPAYIDSSLLTRDTLETEILAWLQKTE
jgi:hypothetical protein